MNRIAVFDMHGIIFSFDRNISKSGDLLDEGVRKKGLVNLDDIKKYLDLEFEIVKEILDNNNALGIYEIPNAINVLMSFVNKGYKIIIVSTSKVETIKIILEYLFRQKEIDCNIIDSFDVFNSAIYGEKDDYLTWKEIFSNYNSIEVIYEDKKKYLNEALRAADELGFESQGFAKIE